MSASSLIFHSKPEDPKKPRRSLHANPYGFAQWFIVRTRRTRTFGPFFEKRSLDFARGRASSPGEPRRFPSRTNLPAYRSRSPYRATVEKRWRNLAYDKRHKSRRLPPSVLLAYYVATHANQTNSLSEELSHQVQSILAVLQAAQRRSETVVEFNPMCSEDKLTDRWPADLTDQAIFVDELRPLPPSSNGCAAKSLSPKRRTSSKNCSVRSPRGRS